MTWLVSPLARSAAVATALLIILAAPAPAAARTARTTASTTGNDISWPQCGGSFPSGQAFGIVGVNDGLANNFNPCLGPYKGGSASTSELSWALQSTGTSKPGTQPKAALYVNTADPGPGVADWPTNNLDPNNNTTSSTCTGGDTAACAWQYGWDRAVSDMDWLAQAATQLSLSGSATGASGYPWWLDVETANSWETGTTGLANNVADLQGMVDALKAGGVTTVGIYSTSYQWGQITGGSQAGNLSGLPDWIPGARRLSSAQSNCSLTGFTGAVTITQWFGQPYDGDYAC